MRHLLTEQSVDYQLRIRLGQFYFKNEHEHSYYKKNVTVWLINEWILWHINILRMLYVFITLNRISFLKHYALKHIVNNGTYYVNINFNVS